MCQRFCAALDCVDIGFLPDGTLDQLPLPAQLGASRVGGIDVNKPRIRAAPAAVLALAPAPGGFTVAATSSPRSWPAPRSAGTTTSRPG
jgi:hypothetical protein